MGEGETENPEQGGTTSPSSQEGNIIIAPIEVIIATGLTDEESDEDHDEDDSQRKKKKKKKGKKNIDKTMILTKTFGQAIRLINEQKVRAN